MNYQCDDAYYTCDKITCNYSKYFNLLKEREAETMKYKRSVSLSPHTNSRKLYYFRNSMFNNLSEILKLVTVISAGIDCPQLNLLHHRRLRHAKLILIQIANDIGQKEMNDQEKM